MKKLLCILLVILTAFFAFPVSAYAEDAVTTLECSYSSGEYAEISWSVSGDYFTGTVVETSADGSAWTQYADYEYGDIECSLNTSAKTLTYVRVKCYKSDGYSRTYFAPSNTLCLYPKTYDLYPYIYCSSKKAEINWGFDSEQKKYVDGFDVFVSVNKGNEKLAKSVSVNEPASDDYYLNYSVKVKKLPKKIYVITCSVKPYFTVNGKKYYTNDGNEKASEVFVSGIVEGKTKKNKIILNLADENIVTKYKIKYTKYKLKTGKTYKTKTVKTTKSKYTIKNADTKNYGYEICVYPIISGIQCSEYEYYDSHSAYALLNGSAKVNNKKIKIIDTTGSKDKVTGYVTLTKSDKKIIKKFFKKKFGDSNPTRAEMADYALNWINKKVTYDYEYKAGNLSYTDAIFNKKLGQCLQYNGAFATVLTYLGYEARIIRGYRLNSSTGKYTVQHFWCEVKLNGRWYLCETGNYGKNGYWQYLVSLYRNSRGYGKHGKAAKD